MCFWTQRFRCELEMCGGVTRGRWPGGKLGLQAPSGGEGIFGGPPLRPGGKHRWFGGSSQPQLLSPGPGHSAVAGPHSLAGPRAGLQSLSSGVSYWPAGQEVFLMKKVALRFVVFFPKCLNKKARQFVQKHFHKKMVLPRLSYSEVSVSARR